jgi:MOSC domain-containing protein YiiM
MLITVLSVNVGSPRNIAAKSGVSGIYKVPQFRPVFVNEDGLVGDTIIDSENHGGFDQAVYVYCQEDYNWWQAQEGLASSPGLFGENLTISGMSSADAHVGARLTRDNLILEITSPRIPCETFAVRMNDGAFPKRFWKSHRTGFYCRVIAPGFIKGEQEMQLVPFNGPHISISEWIENEPLGNMDAATRERFLSVPIHDKARAQLQS